MEDGHDRVPNDFEYLLICLVLIPRIVFATNDNGCHCAAAECSADPLKCYNCYLLVGLRS